VSFFREWDAREWEQVLDENENGNSTRNECKRDLEWELSDRLTANRVQMSTNCILVLVNVCVPHMHVLIRECSNRSAVELNVEKTAAKFSFRVTFSARLFVRWATAACIK